MAEQAYAYVTLIPVAKGFQSAIAKEMGGAGNIGAQAGEQAGGKFKSGFGGALRGIAAIAGTALATIGVGRFFGDAVEQSSRLGESLNAVSVSYGAASAEIIKLGETAANRLGVSTATFNEAAVRFSAFSQRVVGEGGNQAKFIDDITTRATDFASVFNIDVSEALQVFQSGLSGEAEPLKRFGINLLDSEVQAYALANGIGEAGRQLTETEKVQARYGLLLQSTAKTAGDFANTSDGLANSQRILRANFENMQATVGNALTPAMAGLTTALVPVVEQLGAQLVPVMESLTPVITNVAGALPGLLTQLMPLIPVFGSLADLFFQLVQALLPFFVELIAMFVPILDAIMGPLLTVIDAGLEPFMEVLYTIIEALGPLLASLLPVLSQLIVALAPIFIKLIEAALPLIEMILPLLIGLIKFLIPVFMVFADILAKTLVFSIDMFVGALQMGLDFFKFWGDQFGLTFTGISDFFYKIINNMIAGFEGFVNTTIDALNAVISALNSIQVKAPKWVTDLTGMTSFGFAISKLSKVYFRRLSMATPAAPTFMAKGGFVTGPTNAIVGEAGPEVVIPLDRFESMMGLDKPQSAVNYYAAPNKSFDAEQELLLAMRRARLVA